MDSGDSGTVGTVGTVGTPVLKSFPNRGAVTAPPFAVACLVPLLLLQEVLPGAPSGQCCPIVAPSLPQMEVPYSQEAREFCYQLGGDGSN